ncbi:MAG: hypothetical protein LBQ24_06540 [Candidatus Peribacteria bacterium]|nr:hypothetical protein [Candidatus Peribacteria bacterium]
MSHSFKPEIISETQFPLNQTCTSLFSSIQFFSTYTKYFQFSSDKALSAKIKTLSFCFITISTLDVIPENNFPSKVQSSKISFIS